MFGPFGASSVQNRFFTNESGSLCPHDVFAVALVATGCQPVSSH